MPTDLNVIEGLRRFSLAVSEWDRVDALGMAGDEYVKANRELNTSTIVLLRILLEREPTEDEVLRVQGFDHES